MSEMIRRRRSHGEHDETAEERLDRLIAEDQQRGAGERGRLDAVEGAARRSLSRDDGSLRRLRAPLASDGGSQETVSRQVQGLRQVGDQTEEGERLSRMTEEGERLSRLARESERQRLETEEGEHLREPRPPLQGHDPVQALLHWGVSSGRGQIHGREVLEPREGAVSGRSETLLGRLTERPAGEDLEGFLGGGRAGRYGHLDQGDFSVDADLRPRRLDPLLRAHSTPQQEDRVNPFWSPAVQRLAEGRGSEEPMSSTRRTGYVRLRVEELEELKERMRWEAEQEAQRHVLQSGLGVRSTRDAHSYKTVSSSLGDPPPPPPISTTPTTGWVYIGTPEPPPPQVSRARSASVKPPPPPPPPPPVEPPGYGRSPEAADGKVLNSGDTIRTLES